MNLWIVPYTAGADRGWKHGADAVMREMRKKKRIEKSQIFDIELFDMECLYRAKYGRPPALTRVKYAMIRLAGLLVWPWIKKSQWYRIGLAESWEQGASFALQEMVDCRKITEKQRMKYLEEWGI